MQSRPIAENQPETPVRAGVLHAILRLLMLVAFGNCIVLCALPLAPQLKGILTQGFDHRTLRAPGLLLEAAGLSCGAVLVLWGLYWILRKLEPWLESNALAQSQFLDTFDSRYVDLAIVLSAALSLFLELALIRWQSSVLEFLAFYKNFSLVACFAGLGFGYSLASRDRIPLLLVIPLLGWQICFMLLTRLVPGLFRVIPFREQLTMGIVGRADLPRTVILFTLLSIVFLITAVTFIPIGQLCGRLMERRRKLRAYGLNLLGSLVGVLLMMSASFFWTPPVVWFALCAFGILMFHLRQTSSLITGIVFTLVCMIALAWWPVDRLWNRVYSPYQLLEIGAAPDSGLTLIRAAGHYYQRIHNLSGANLAPEIAKTRDYYDLPFKATSALSDVAVVGSGTGNDVAAALRAGAGSIDAIEIDPAILEVGRSNHPEQPYLDPRVHAVNNDARSFLRRTDRKYDLVVYGLLDSHTLLTQGSSVRLDSFVYTIEGLREAKARLKPSGLISLAFSVLSDELGRKIYLMLEQVFGRPPLCIRAGYDGAVVFLAPNDSHWTPPANLLGKTGFADVSRLYGDPVLQATVSTDDWPFFYMPRRVYPVSYLIMIAQILLLSLVLAGNFFAEQPRFSNLTFFFLGVGFMLIETKGITEMGLTFGNNWQVIGVVIAGILIMAFLGNCLVQWLNIKRSLAPYLFLWAALALGWGVSRSGGFASTAMGRLETAIVLTLPLLFSGIVFSTSLAGKGQVSGMMAMNLLGSICGGLLEYNSMYFGFRALYLMAMGCYLLAFISSLVFRQDEGSDNVVIASAAEDKHRRVNVAFGAD
jgi:hypothetical protein